MSKYMELKAQIEQLTGQLEQARREEVEVEVLDMRKRIFAFGIEPHQLFPDLKQDRKRARARSHNRPVLYAWGGNTWGGGQGPKPKWFESAQKAGISLDQMKAEAAKLNGGATP